MFTRVITFEGRADILIDPLFQEFWLLWKFTRICFLEFFRIRDNYIAI